MPTDANATQAEIRHLLVQWVIHTRGDGDAVKIAQYMADLRQRKRPIADVPEVVAGVAAYVAGEILDAVDGDPTRAARALAIAQKRGTPVGTLGGVPEALADLCAELIVQQCGGCAEEIRDLLADLERRGDPVTRLPALRQRCRAVFARMQKSNAVEAAQD